jgi:hypothetical protein
MLKGKESLVQGEPEAPYPNTFSFGRTTSST